MNACILVPAYNAAASLAAVVSGLRAELRDRTDSGRERHDLPILVIDDGSSDGTSDAAKQLAAEVIGHPNNRGKGAALRSGLAWANERGFDVALTVDADGQHPPASARAVLEASANPAALVLGVRDLVRDGAPPKSQFSNRVSNVFLSLFTGRPLADTQCGLRRYPVAETLALGGVARGYAFEAEILIRAIRAGTPIVEVPIAVHYPPEHERVTHFHSVKDPARIVGAVVATLFELELRGAASKLVQKIGR